jgi:hypothetical protein
MKRLLSIDRRIIFLLVLSAVVAGTLFPERLHLPIKTSKPVRGIFEAVEKLEAGAPVMLALDFDPSSAPELEPMARAVLRQCLRRGLHAIGMTHWNTGLALAEQIMKETAMEFDDVELESLPLDSERIARACGKAMAAAKTQKETQAILRLVAAGERSEVQRLFEPFAPHTWIGNLIRKCKGVFGAGGSAPGSEEKALDAIVAAAEKIPPHEASARLTRRKVNFARDKLTFDAKFRARNLLWHARAGEIVSEPVPVVDEKGDVTGWEIVKVLSRTPTLAYGKDWCFLGYKAGVAILMISMGQNLYAAFPTDKYNTPSRELPILENVASLAHVKYLVAFAAGNTGEQWIVYGSGRYGFPMGVGCTAVIAPDLYPYYGSGQITGIAGGIKGAWEYETLVGIPDRATQAAPVQTVAHVLVIALILFCNVAFFAQRLFARGANA